MKNYIHLSMIFIVALGYLAFHSCNVSFRDDQDPIIPSYGEVNLDIDGDLSDWLQMDSVFYVHHFYAPWTTAPVATTTFKAVSDGHWFYFCFNVEDESVVTAPFGQELDITLGDRVELFVSGDAQLDTYYCMEIAPNGRVLDYHAQFYRQFDDSWNLENLEVKTKLTDIGYCVEGKFPVSFLKGLGSISKGDSAQVWLGLYRAEFDYLEQSEQEVKWMSWIIPHAEQPDFHIPSSFQQVTIKD